MAITIKGSKTTEAATAAWAALLGKGDPEPITNLIENAAKAGPASATALFRALQQAVRDFFGDIALSFSGVLESDLESLGVIKPGDAKAEFEKAMGDAFEFGMTAHLTAVGAELFHPIKHLGVPTIAALMAEFSGFKELVGAYHGPLVNYALRVPSMAEHAKKFRSMPPPGRDAAQWRARRLIADTAADDPIAWSGLMPEYEDAEKLAAFRPVQPRAIASAIQDTPFPHDDMQKLLEFGGYRDADIALLLKVFEYNSVKNVRQQYLNAIITAAERGTLTDADLESDLTDLDFSNQAKHFVRLTVAVRKLEMLLELYRKQVTILYETGQLLDADYVPTLEAAGIANADAEAHYGLDSSRLKGRVLLAAERAAAADARRLEAVAVKDAEEQFMTNTIDAVALAAALAGAGVPLPMVPHLVAIFAARKGGAQQLVYGKLVDRKDGALLREQVAALKEQVLKKLVDVATARAQLESYGIPVVNRDALLAEWFAQATKTVLPV